MFERTRYGAVTVVSGSAPLTRDQVADVSRELHACLAEGQPMAVLNLSDVPLMDSAGLQLLMEIQDEFVRRGGMLKLARPNPLCYDVLHVTRLDRYFDIHDNVTEAVGSFLK